MFQVKRFDFEDEGIGHVGAEESAQHDHTNVDRGSSGSQHLEELHRLAAARKRKRGKLRVPENSLQHETQAAASKSDPARLSVKPNGLAEEITARQLSIAQPSHHKLQDQQPQKQLNRRQRRRLAQRMANHSSDAAGKVDLHYPVDDTIFIESSKSAGATTASSDGSFPRKASFEVEGSTVPLEKDALDWGLDEVIVNSLRENGYSHFFPIQRRAIPLVLRGDSRVSGLHEDICVSAPTGSGKTMVYAIATVQALINRVIPRLRALVVLPSRDLAVQVYEVYSAICRSLHLRVALGVSNHVTSFVSEQVFVRKADILVCTPGRLLDHIRGTPGFTLQYLQMLVVDEADRLLSQSYQSWVKAVFDSIKKAPKPHQFSFPEGTEDNSRLASLPAFTIVPSATHSRAAHDASQTSSLFAGRLRKLLFSATLTTDPKHIASLELVNPRFISLVDTTPNFAAHIFAQPSVKKSASKTSAAAMIKNMKGTRKNAKLYRIPDTLQENVILCTAEEKPFKLILLLKSLQSEHGKDLRTLVFTRSISSAHRLCRLLQLFYVFDTRNTDSIVDPLETGNGDEIHNEARVLHKLFPQTCVAEYSSMVSPKKRAKILKRFSSHHHGKNRNTYQILVCTDAGSRGLDIENVTFVVNYDVPTLSKAYVHRVGRTARAGKTGSCFTFLQPGQEGGFHSMMKQIEHNRVNISQPRSSDNRKQIQSDYSLALKHLKNIAELEEDEPEYRVH